jgi:hypothetical protein
MSYMGFQPNLVAASTILPFRLVEMTTTAFTGQAATAVTDNIIGVTDGSVRRFDSANHAEAGDRINLQPGNVVQVTASGSIAIAANLTSTTGGKVATASGGNKTHYIALESAGADGDVIWAFRIGSFLA